MKTILISKNRRYYNEQFTGKGADDGGTPLWKNQCSGCDEAKL